LLLLLHLHLLLLLVVVEVAACLHQWVLQQTSQHWHHHPQQLQWQQQQWQQQAWTWCAWHLSQQEAQQLQRQLRLLLQPLLLLLQLGQLPLLSETTVLPEMHAAHHLQQQWWQQQRQRQQVA
jgi:hypothetical protein